MKLGIKFGPRKESIANLEDTNAEFVEVWFRIDKLDTYQPYFQYFKEHRIPAGLHFWGLTQDGYLPSIVHPDMAFRTESMDLIKKTIDIAALHHFVYVNIHPGHRAKVALNFDTQTYGTPKDIIDQRQADKIYQETSQKLASFALSQGVLLTVETTTPRAMSDFYNPKMEETRKTPLQMYEYALTVLNASQIHTFIANDFGHTAASLITSERDKIWQFLRSKTVEFAPKTKLLHVGYIVPPYNGTDFHDHLDNPVFATNRAVPNRSETIELLRLFIQRPDVFALVEPMNGHPKNYRLLRQLAEEVR